MWPAHYSVIIGLMALDAILAKQGGAGLDAAECRARGVLCSFRYPESRSRRSRHGRLQGSANVRRCQIPAASHANGSHTRSRVRPVALPSPLCPSSPANLGSDAYSHRPTALTEEIKDVAGIGRAQTFTSASHKWRNGGIAVFPIRVRVPVDRDHGFRWKMITRSGGT